MAEESGTGDRLVLATEDNPFGMRLELQGGGLECYGQLPRKGEQEITPRSLRELLEQQGIRIGVLHDAIKELCETAKKEGKAARTLLARGTAPGVGHNGRFVMNDLRSRERLQLDDQGRVDLRNLNPLDNVSPGQLIGRLEPPTQGDEGRAVTGEPIPGCWGEPLDLHCGEGAEMNAESREVCATLAGRVLFDGKLVTVAKDYVVDGAVDYSVGNIDFNGLVRIGGDVLDGFTIRGGKGLKVGGDIGACTIDCGGDLFAGGVAGQGRGIVRCQGTLKVRYLNDVTVECDGDVIVENEIRNSTVKSRGRILVTGGTIIGGECVAFGGIEVKQLGAPNGARTRLFVGIDFGTLDRLRQLKRDIDSLQEQIAQARRVVESIRKRSIGADEAPPALQHLQKRHEGLVRARAELEGQSQALRILDPEAVLQVNVREALHERVIVTLGFATSSYTAEIHGPVTLIRESEETLRCVDPAPLGTFHAELDSDAVQWGQ